MSIFNFLNSDKQKIKKLIKDREKKEKEIEKQMEQNMKKYEINAMKEAKNIMIDRAKEIDTTEYEMICQQLKEKLNK